MTKEKVAIVQSDIFISRELKDAYLDDDIVIFTSKNIK